MIAMSASNINRNSPAKTIHMKDEWYELFDFMLKAWIYSRKGLEFKQLQIANDQGSDNLIDFVNSDFTEAFIEGGKIKYRPSYDAICWALERMLKPIEEDFEESRVPIDFSNPFKFKQNS